jgi:hypothetical protein
MLLLLLQSLLLLLQSLLMLLLSPQMVVMHDFSGWKMKRYC